MSIAVINHDIGFCTLTHVSFLPIIASTHYRKDDFTMKEYEHNDYYDSLLEFESDHCKLRTNSQSAQAEFIGLGFSEKEANNLASSGYAILANTVVVDTFHGGALAWHDRRTRFPIQGFREMFSKGQNSVKTFRATSITDVLKIVDSLPESRNLLFRGQTASHKLNRKIENPALTVTGYGEISLLPSVWRRVLRERRDLFHEFRNLSLFDWSSILYDPFDLQAIVNRNLTKDNYTINDMEDSDDLEIARFGRLRNDLTMGYNFNLTTTLATLLQHYGLYSPVLDVSTDVEIALFFATHKFSKEDDKCRYHFVGTNGRNSVLYVLKDKESTNYERLRLLEDLDPQRPKRQACVVIPTDSYCMNLPADLLVAVIALDFELTTPSKVRAADIFPGPEEDRFLLALKRQLSAEARSSLTLFDNQA